MTPPARSPSAPRHLLYAAAFLVLLAAILTSAPYAQGAEDDFEFGRALAKARYFDYARKVYDAILTDKNRSDEDKDEARYGIALLKKEEAMAAAARGDVKYEDIVALFDGAANDIQEFVRKNPKNTNAPQARLDVGTIRLAFVQWARELINDPDELASRAEQGFEVNKLIDDAQRSVDQAIDYFGSLRAKESDLNPKPYEELASYYYVISQYYRALVEPPCSPAAMAALEKAGRDLEEYIMFHDGQLLGVYAQDIYGLVWWELAKCASDPEKKALYFNKAFEWFETCIYADDEGPDYLRIITSGYYHIAQAGRDAASMPQRNFARDALTHLKTMLDRHATAWRTDNGLRAMVEHSKLECERGNVSQAIEVAKDAAERARKAGKPHLERLANRQLNVYVSGGCGGAISGLVDPEVLRRVADDLFLAGRYQDAIRAYGAVIASTPNTTQAFLEHRWHAWRRMASAYKMLGDRLGEALAYEPIHDAWVQRRIPRVAGQSDDPNLVEAGNNRRAAELAFKDLANETGSSVFRTRYKDMSTKFLQDYPDHTTVIAGEWNTAIDKWGEALKQRAKNDSRWPRTMKDAQEHFVNVSGNPDSPKQDAAWVYLIRVGIEQKKYEDAVKQAEKTFDYWKSPEARAQEEKFASVRKRRAIARARATVWMARALLELDRHGDVVAALDGYHTKHTNAGEFYPSIAYDYLVQSHLAQGNVTEAATHYRALLRSDPKYYRLDRITFLLAGHFNKLRAVIEKQILEVTITLNETRKALREAQRESIRLGALVSDLRNQRRKARQAIDFDAKEKKEGREGLPERDVDNHEKTLEDLAKRMPKLETDLKAWVSKRDLLEARATEFFAKRDVLRQEIYEPLIEGASYYKEWDDTLKRTGADRHPKHVAVFAHLFWNAGRLRPEVKENWVNARGLYEDYLAFEQVKNAPPTDQAKRSAIARLGDVYINLALGEEDPSRRRELVRRAVDLLQRSIAVKAADNDIVVGMLADKVLVIKWRDPRSNRRWRFPIPRPASVTELRNSVKNMGKEGGPPLPAFENEQEEKEYREALKLFRRALSETDDRDLQRLVSESGKSTFDPVLYREMANYDTEFRLALAWAYSESGREEDVPKAVNLALSLVAPPLGVEEDTENWWQARTIQIRVYIKTAERKLGGDATSSADAVQWLERAGNVFKAVAASYPDLGETAVPGNGQRWREMLEKLNALRRKAGMTPVNVYIATRGAAEGTEGEEGDSDTSEAPSETDK